MSAQGFGFNYKATSADSYWWARVYDSGLSVNLSNVPTVCVDTSNNIYAFIDSMQAVKFNNAGSIQFQNIDQTSSYTSQAGYATSAGDSYQTGAAGTTNTVILDKRSSSGTLTWVRSLSSLRQNGGAITNSSSDVYVTTRTVSGSTTTGNQIIKVAAAGTISWQREINVSPLATPVRVTLDSSENVFLCGNTVTGAGYLIKYNLSGTYQWYKVINVGLGKAVTDSSGNIYALADGGVAVIKFDTTGAITWQKTIKNSANTCTFNDICIDSSSNIYVCGTDNTSSIGVVAKLNSSGTAQWMTTINFTSASSGSVSPNSIAINSLGSLIVSGQYNPAANNLFIVKVPSTGTRTGTYGDLVYGTGSASLSTPTYTSTTGSLTSSTSSYTIATPSNTLTTTTYTTATTTI